jgi:hypothetical protein
VLEGEDAEREDVHRYRLDERPGAPLSTVFGTNMPPTKPIA